MSGALGGPRPAAGLAGGSLHSSLGPPNSSLPLPRSTLFMHRYRGLINDETNDFPMTQTFSDNDESRIRMSSCLL